MTLGKLFCDLQDYGKNLPVIFSTEGGEFHNTIGLVLSDGMEKVYLIPQGKRVMSVEELIDRLDDYVKANSYFKPDRFLSYQSFSHEVVFLCFNEEVVYVKSAMLSEGGQSVILLGGN